MEPSHQPPGHVSIDPATGIGIVGLTVADLERSVGYYTEGIGLIVLSRTDGEAKLGVPGRALLHLIEQPGARRWTESSTGLYHVAIRLPSSVDLGLFIQHWEELSWGPLGEGDHIVSQALYLRDPDGHGIEIYRDRPPDQWTWTNGRVLIGGGPVDLDGLLNEARKSGRSWAGLLPETVMGHVHLQVGDTSVAADFYCMVLGFDIVCVYRGVVFASAGGYHHHLAMNTWHSLDGSAAESDVAKLAYFTIELPDRAALEDVLSRVRAAAIPAELTVTGAIVVDPWGTTIRLEVASAG